MRHLAETMVLSLSGNIRKTPLPEVLADLRARKATGTLSLRRKSVEKCIHLKEGQIIFASSNDQRDRLGDSLVRAGKITRDGLDRALKLYEKHGGLKKMGAILVESGLIPPKELFSGLKIQVKDIIYSMLLWNDAEFAYEDRLPSDVIHLHINIEELIAELIERVKKEA
jgi:hypothetical protein